MINDIMDTERLIVYPLSKSELVEMVSSVSSLEQKLNVSYQAEKIVGVFKEIIISQTEKTLENESDFIWLTFWLIIRKTDRVVVGLACFHDLPNQMGEVEIGYGLGENFTKQGYITEVVQKMCDWALNQNGVKSVVAETDLDGIASQSVLKSCGFEIKSKGESLWWSLSKK